LSARDESPVREGEGGVTLSVVVKVRARKSAVLGLEADHLSVALAAPPVDGAANEALKRTLAEHFGLARSHVRIVSGEKNRRKVVELRGIDRATVLARLAAAGQGS
jgi:uncharacterized protein (TIGR00251 family)